MNFIENIVENPSSTIKEYEEDYEKSIDNPDAFWKEKAESLSWIKKFSKVKESSFNDKVSIKWFSDGILNASANCIDRHLKDKGNKTAIIWESDNKLSKKITFNELYKEVCKLANGLKSIGVKKGDRVTIYLPMIPEAAYAMLACSRIGAIHSVVFGGFAPESLRDRIKDCESSVVITANEGIRGGKKIPLLSNVKKAIDKLKIVKKVIVVKRTELDENFDKEKDVWYHDLVSEQKSDCPVSEQSSEDPLFFILYTSGSTGKPKGVLHTTAGYLLHASFTHKKIFNVQENDIYWCTADVGWVTGHSYIIYGPLCNGTTTLMFEGIPTYPDASRFWEIIDKFKVNIFYTAPTAIRALMGLGDEFVEKCSLASLKVLGSVGEPINPEAWKWYFETVGKKNVQS